MGIVEPVSAGNATQIAKAAKAKVAAEKKADNAAWAAADAGSLGDSKTVAAAVTEQKKTSEEVKVAREENTKVEEETKKIQAQDDVSGIYQEVLGRAPDEEGLKLWTEQAANGMSPDEIRKEFENSPEGQAIAEQKKQDRIAAEEALKAEFQAGQTMNGPGGEELLDLINDAEESLDFNDLRDAYDLSNEDERSEFNDIRNQILNQAREDGVEGLGVVVSDLSPEEQEAYHQEVTMNRFNDTFGLDSKEQYNYLRKKGFSDNDIEAITAENNAMLDDMLDLVLEANTLGTDAYADAGSLGISLELEPGTTNTTAGLQLLYEQGKIPEEYLPFLPSIVNSVEQTVQAQSNVNYATSVSDQVSDEVIAHLFDETGVTHFDENIFGDFKEENQWDDSMFTTANGRADGISSNIQLEMTNIEANPTAESVEASLERIEGFYSSYNTDEDNAMLDSFKATLLNLNSDLTTIEATADNNDHLTLAEDGFNALSDIYKNDVRGGIIRQATSNVFAGEFGDTENQQFIEEREQELAAIGYLASIPDDERTDEQQQQMDILLSAITGVDMNSGITTGLGYTSELEQRNAIYTDVTKDNTKNVIALGAAVVGTVGGGILGTTVAPITGGSSVAGGTVAGTVIGVGAGASLLGIDDITGSDYTAEEYLEVSLRSGLQGGIGGGGAAFGNVALGSAPSLFRTGAVGVGENVITGNLINASDTFVTSGGDFGETFDDFTTLNSIDVATGFIPLGGTSLGRLGRNGDNLSPVIDDALEIADVSPVTGNNPFNVTPPSVTPPSNLTVGGMVDSDYIGNVFDTPNGPVRIIAGPDGNGRVIPSSQSVDEASFLNDNPHLLMDENSSGTNVTDDLNELNINTLNDGEFLGEGAQATVTTIPGLDGYVLRKPKGSGEIDLTQELVINDNIPLADRNLSQTVATIDGADIIRKQEGIVYDARTIAPEDIQVEYTEHLQRLADLPDDAFDELMIDIASINQYNQDGFGVYWGGESASNLLVDSNAQRINLVDLEYDGTNIQYNATDVFGALLDHNLSREGLTNNSDLVALKQNIANKIAAAANRQGVPIGNQAMTIDMLVNSARVETLPPPMGFPPPPQFQNKP